MPKAAHLVCAELGLTPRQAGSRVLELGPRPGTFSRCLKGSKWEWGLAKTFPGKKQVLRGGSPPTPSLPSLVRPSQSSRVRFLRAADPDPRLGKPGVGVWLCWGHNGLCPCDSWGQERAGIGHLSPVCWLPRRARTMQEQGATAPRAQESHQMYSLTAWVKGCMRHLAGNFQNTQERTHKRTRQLYAPARST